MAISGIGSSPSYFAYSPQAKGENIALSYNHQQSIAEQNAKTGSQLSFEKERAAIGADIILNLVV